MFSQKYALVNERYVNYLVNSSNVRGDSLCGHIKLNEETIPTRKFCQKIVIII